MQKIFFTFIFFCVVFIVSGAERRAELLNPDTVYDFSGKVSYYEDKSSLLDYEQISDSSFFKYFISLPDEVRSLGNKTSTFWFSIDLYNQTKAENWLIHVDYPVLNRVTFFLQNPKGELDTVIYQGLDLQSGKMRTGHLVLAEVNLKPGKVHRLFVKVKTNSYLFFPLKVQRTLSYIKQAERKQTIYLSFYGITIGMVLLNIVLLILTREKTYLWLSVFLLTMVVNSHYQYGYGFHCLNLGINGSDALMRTLLFYISLITFTIFSYFYLDVNRYKKLQRLFTLFVLLFLLIFFLACFSAIPPAALNKVTPGIYLAGSFIGVGAALFTVQRGHRPSVYYIFAFSVFLFSSIIWILLLSGFLRYNFFVYNVNILSGSLFGLLLTIGLMDKITAIKREKAKNAELAVINVRLEKEISERKQLEKALGENEKKFRLLFHLSPQAIALIEMETGKMVDVNQQMSWLTGYAEDELCGKTSLEVNLIENQSREAVVKKIMNEGEIKNLELNLRRKDGYVVSSILNSNKAIINEKELIISVFSDITELKRNQAEIKKFSTAIEQSANSILITDPQGYIEYANSRLFELTGYQSSEILGKKPNVFKSGYHSSEFYEALWRDILSGKTWKGEFLNRKKNGELFWEMATITPVLEDGNKLAHILAIKEDVTEIKVQQEALAQSEKELRKLNATKDLFFSIIGHDLMNPFNALMGFNELVSDAIRNHQYKQAIAYSDIVADSSKRILSLLQNLLIWSRVKSGKLIFQPVHVKADELIENAISVFNESLRRKHIEFKKMIDLNKSLFVDQNMVETIIRNLVGNAIKFSDTGGTILVKVAIIENEWLFVVSDNGVGIEPQFLKELFDLEKTLSTKGTEGEVGTGLGLVICREFVTAHHGKIWVESEHGKGSQFYFTIPVHED